MAAQDSEFKKIHLVSGGVAKVSPCDYPRLSKYRWHKRKDDGYASRTEYRDGEFKTIRMHQEIIVVPEGYVTDHINRDRLDNRRCNLRKATRSQNTANSKIPSTNTSGYKGVYFRKDQNRWRASIRVEGILISLGQYGSAEDAAKAYNKAASKHFGEYALLNELPDDEDIDEIIKAKADSGV